MFVSRNKRTVNKFHLRQFLQFARVRIITECLANVLVYNNDSKVKRAGVY